GGGGGDKGWKEQKRGWGADSQLLSPQEEKESCRREYEGESFDLCRRGARQQEAREELSGRRRRERSEEQGGCYCLVEPQPGLAVPRDVDVVAEEGESRDDERGREDGGRALTDLPRDSGQRERQGGEAERERQRRGAPCESAGDHRGECVEVRHERRVGNVDIARAGIRQERHIQRSRGRERLGFRAPEEEKVG